MDEPRPTADLAARDVYEAWAAAMDRQGRVLPPTRRTWDVLPQQERDLDADIAYQLNQLVRAAARPADGEELRAVHREAIWDERGYHPGYGKGVCEYDGEPWPCKHRRAAARPADGEEGLIGDLCWTCGKHCGHIGAARRAVGEEGLRAALHDAMAFGHTLATSPGPSLGHSGERYTDCPQPLCRRCAALAAAEPAKP